MAYTYSFAIDKQKETNLQENPTTVFSQTTDSLALVDLYNATDGANWTISWNLSNPIRTWYGVTVNGRERVTRLSVGFNNLVGYIPSTLGNMIELEHLEIGDNQLTGSIPPFLGNLISLEYLYLSGCQLTGSIPASFGNLVNLQFMFLSYNQLSGSIPPASLPQSLLILDLSRNQLTGAIPAQTGNLSNLLELYLHFNQLSGSIPPELGNLTSVMTFDISNNLLTGQIPPELGNLANSVVYGFSVSNNNLSGCFPLELVPLCNTFNNFSNNPNLPGGGDFNAFCANRTGACPCVNNRNVLGTISTGTYNANANLTSNGTVATGSNVIFKAGQSILLNNNFTVEAGAEFTAEIESCF